MENILIFLGMAVIGYVGFKLWKSKKRNPTDPNFVDPGVKDDIDLKK